MFCTVRICGLSCILCQGAGGSPGDPKTAGLFAFTIIAISQLRPALDHCPGISFHVGVCPAGAEIDISPVVLVLVDDLIRVGLTGVTTGVDLIALAVPAAGNLDEVISPVYDPLTSSVFAG